MENNSLERNSNARESAEEDISRKLHLLTELMLQAEAFLTDFEKGNEVFVKNPFTYLRLIRNMLGKVAKLKEDDALKIIWNGESKENANTANNDELNRLYQRLKNLEHKFAASARGEKGLPGNEEA